jgi:glycosyltransferase involved in cell wall biosynthesis
VTTSDIPTSGPATTADVPPADAALPTVSIVIPTYRRAARLAPVVAAALATGAHEVIVVVDGSRDGSLELLAAMAVDEPRLRAMEQDNAGAPAARQAGVHLATGDVVLLLDDDVRATPGLATGHARRHRDATGLVVVGAMPTPVPPRTPGSVTTRLYAAEYAAVQAGWCADPDGILRSLWAGNLSLRRTDAERVGLHNPNGDAGYHEDLDFGLRCLRAGLRGVFAPELVAHHHHVRPLDALRRDARSQGRGMWEVHRIHGDLLEPIAEDHYLADLPAPLPAVLRRVGRGRVGAAAADVLAVSGRIAGRARAWPVESAAVRLLRRLEAQRALWAAAAR